MKPDLLKRPQFEFVNDHSFELDMASIVPDEHVRDDVVDSIGWTITHTLVGDAKPVGMTTLTGPYKLLITEKKPICPALRVLFSVQDEPPKRRWITFHRASLRG